MPPVDDSEAESEYLCAEPKPPRLEPSVKISQVSNV